ncbi:MAG TPA: ABC transporter substrate binding protein [Steroidobacteraceae bacterium]|nr:ABC transporter substrate binding protein [Steroidobacteraceae bacterium]
MRTHRRSLVLGIASLACAWPLLASCVHPVTATRVPRIGYREGDNIFIEWRLSRPNTTDPAVQAGELAHRDLDWIVVGALPYALEVRKANPAMTMVIATCPDMVSNGFAQSLEHPGGNATGIDELPPDVTAKRLQLLQAALVAIASEHRMAARAAGLTLPPALLAQADRVLP